MAPFWISVGGQNLLRINVPPANPRGSRLKNQGWGWGAFLAARPIRSVDGRRAGVGED